MHGLLSLTLKTNVHYQQPVVVQTAFHKQYFFTDKALFLILLVDLHKSFVAHNTIFSFFLYRKMYLTDSATFL